jgi:hypothetical protein
MRMQRCQGALWVLAADMRGPMSKLPRLPMDCPAGGVNAMLENFDVIATASSMGCARKGCAAPLRSSITAQPHDQSAAPDAHATFCAAQRRPSLLRHTVTRA